MCRWSPRDGCGVGEADKSSVCPRGRTLLALFVCGCACNLVFINSSACSCTTKITSCSRSITGKPSTFLDLFISPLSLSLFFFSFLSAAVLLHHSPPLPPSPPVWSHGSPVLPVLSVLPLLEGEQSLTIQSLSHLDLVLTRAFHLLAPFPLDQLNPHTTAPFAARLPPLLCTKKVFIEHRSGMNCRPCCEPCYWIVSDKLIKANFKHSTRPRAQTNPSQKQRNGTSPPISQTSQMHPSTLMGGRQTRQRRSQLLSAVAALACIGAASASVKFSTPEGLTFKPGDSLWANWTLFTPPAPYAVNMNTFTLVIRAASGQKYDIQPNVQQSTLSLRVKVPSQATGGPVRTQTSKEMPLH